MKIVNDIVVVEELPDDNHGNNDNDADDLFISTKVDKLYTRRFGGSLQSFQEVGGVKLEQDKFGTCLVWGTPGASLMNRYYYLNQFIFRKY